MISMPVHKLPTCPFPAAGGPDRVPEGRPGGLRVRSLPFTSMGEESPQDGVSPSRLAPLAVIREFQIRGSGKCSTMRSRRAGVPAEFQEIRQQSKA